MFTQQRPVSANPASNKQRLSVSFKPESNHSNRTPGQNGTAASVNLSATALPATRTTVTHSRLPRSSSLTVQDQPTTTHVDIPHWEPSLSDVPAVNANSPTLAHRPRPLSANPHNSRTSSSSNINMNNNIGSGGNYRPVLRPSSASASSSSASPTMTSKPAVRPKSALSRQTSFDSSPKQSYQQQVQNAALHARPQSAAASYGTRPRSALSTKSRRSVSYDFSNIVVVDSKKQQQQQQEPELNVNDSFFNKFLKVSGKVDKESAPLTKRFKSKAIDIEIQIAERMRALRAKPVGPCPVRLRIFQEAFDDIIENDKVFGILLEQIKDEYDAHLTGSDTSSADTKALYDDLLLEHARLKRSIAHMNEDATSYKQEVERLSAENREIEKMLEQQSYEADKWRKKYAALESESDQSLQKQQQLQTKVQELEAKTLAALQTEVSAPKKHVLESVYDNDDVEPAQLDHFDEVEDVEQLREICRHFRVKNLALEGEVRVSHDSEKAAVEKMREYRSQLATLRETNASTSTSASATVAPRNHSSPNLMQPHHRSNDSLLNRSLPQSKHSSQMQLLQQHGTQFSNGSNARSAPVTPPAANRSPNQSGGSQTLSRQDSPRRRLFRNTNASSGSSPISNIFAPRPDGVPQLRLSMLDKDGNDASVLQAGASSYSALETLSSDRGDSDREAEAEEEEEEDDDLSPNVSELHDSDLHMGDTLLSPPT